MHTVGPGIWRENGKSRKMRNIHLTTLKNDKITEKRDKCEMYTVGPGIWQEY